MALKAITNALSLEEQLFNNNPERIQDIGKTYLNRSAILTKMKRHDKAVITLNKAVQYIQDIDLNKKSKEDKE